MASILISVAECLQDLGFNTVRTGSIHRAPNSGDWLQDHEQYRSWLDKGGVL